MRLRATFSAAALLIPLVAAAAQFPDVPETYEHAHAIERLSEMGVIGGNPDGTFKPHDPVNRAAMLKMLYAAAKLSPDRVGGCFPDVQPGSWYESIVCDAAKRGFVQGYADAAGAKSFKPGQSVTRAEALKLTLAILGIPEANLDIAVNMYTDVATGDWFARYVHTALARAILPIPGQDGATYSPGNVLERGEAAAYIWKAIEAGRNAPPVASSSSSSTSSMSEEQKSSAASDVETRAAAALRVIQHEEDALKRAQANTLAVKVPFTDKRSFDGKTPFSYEFGLSATTIVDITSSINDWTMGTMTCRLYHLGRSGFSQEYFLGFQDGKNCIIRGALGPGNWRLQLQPSMLAPAFTVTAKLFTAGDGNDGFVQAATLPLGQARTDILDQNDLEDWYKFTIPRDAKTVEDGGRQLTLGIVAALRPDCVIYPMDDVDVYGFKNPDCEHSYLYPPGTYYVAIRHSPPFAVKQTYSIQIK